MSIDAVAGVPAYASPPMPAPDRPSLRRLLWRPGSVVVLGAGLALRAWLLVSPVSSFNADEAVTGLMARQISHGTPRLILAGAAYTAPVESWLYAPIYAVTGPHILGLKLLTIALWAVASVLMVGAARRVVTDRAALLAGAALWVTPGALANLSVRAYVGYASGLCVLVALVWSSLISAQEGELAGDGPPVVRSAVTGGLAGLVFYVHPMFVSVALPAAACLCVIHRRRLRRWWIPALVAAFVVNIPFLLWNVRNDWASLHPIDPANPGTPSSRLRHFFTDLIPRMAGMRTDAGRWVLGRPLGVVVTVAAAGVVGAGAVVLIRRSRAGVVIAAALVLAWPIMSAFGAMSYVADGRYGVITLPFAVVAAAAALDRWLLSRTLVPPRLLAPLVGAVWLALVVVPYDRANAGTDPVHPNADLATVMRRIDESGLAQVAGSYWVMQQVDYLSRGRHAGPMMPGYPERFPESQQMHPGTRADQLGFVFITSDETTDYLLLRPDQYRREQYGDYVLYVPLNAPGA
jgi:hypothetical protein